MRNNPNLTEAEKIALLEKMLMGFCAIADKEYQLCKKA